MIIDIGTSTSYSHISVARSEVAGALFHFIWNKLWPLMGTKYPRSGNYTSRQSETRMQHMWVCEKSIYRHDFGHQRAVNI